MTPCVFTDPVVVGTTSDGCFSVINILCTKHNTIAACAVLFNLDQAVKEMKDRIEAHCFEKFMKSQMGILQKENP